MFRRVVMRTDTGLGEAYMAQDFEVGVGCGRELGGGGQVLWM